MDDKRQCEFYVKKRKRLCRLIPAKGKRFCGEHLNHENDSTILRDCNERSSSKERICCPYDPHHTVSSKQLQKHLKVCNSRPKEKPVYYQKGINAGSYDTHEELDELHLVSFSLDELREIISKVESAYADHVPSITTQVLHHKALKAELDNDSNGLSARKHLVQLASLLGHMTKHKLLNPATCYVEFGAGRGRLSQWIQQGLDSLDNTSFLLVDKAAVRHKRDVIYQSDAGGAEYKRINMDIEDLCLGKVPNVCSHPTRPLVAYTKHLCGAATDLALRCLMETKQSSPKKDEKSAETASVASCIDQKINLNVSSSPEDNTSTIRLSSSVDRSVQSDDTASHSRSDDGSEIPPRVSNLVRGVVMALCCHHRCLWRPYVGKKFFGEVGISEREFMAVVRMSSWATCGSRSKQDENDGGDSVRDEGMDDRADHQEVKEEGMKEMEREKEEEVVHDCTEERESVTSSLGLTVPQREEIGFKCKRLLDTGRLLYLRDLGLQSELVYYVERSTSPENTVLIGVPIVR